MYKLVCNHKFPVKEDVSIIDVGVLCSCLHRRGHVQGHADVVTGVHKDEHACEFCFPLYPGMHPNMFVLRLLVCWHALEKCCECSLENMLTMLCELKCINAGGWCLDWTMCGQSNKVCEKWMRPIITKVLINIRWRLNSLIDNNGSKPPDVDPEHWKTLVSMRATEAAQVRSEHMRGISKGKGSTTAQMKAIEREVMSRLVSQLSWYVETDVVAEVILYVPKLTCQQ
jgi:hypothetical protein